MFYTGTQAKNWENKLKRTAQTPTSIISSTTLLLPFPVAVPSPVVQCPHHCTCSSTTSMDNSSQPIQVGTVGAPFYLKGANWCYRSSNCHSQSATPGAELSFIFSSYNFFQVLWPTAGTPKTWITPPARQQQETSAILSPLNTQTEETTATE